MKKTTLVFFLLCALFLTVYFVFFKNSTLTLEEDKQVDEVENLSKHEEIIEADEKENQIDEYIDYDINDESHISIKPSMFYLALGDSLTKGVGDEENKKGFTLRLEEKIEKFNDTDVFVDNRGKSGRRSDQLLKLIENGHYDEELENADLITITIGGNDIMKIVKANLTELEKQPFDEGRKAFEERLTKIVSEIRTRNKQVPIILIGIYNPFTTLSNEVPEFDNIVDEWNETIEQIANSTQKACFVKVNDLFDSNSNMIYHSDFFHPNSYGYTMITERIVLSMLESNIRELNQLISDKNSSYNKR